MVQARELVDAFRNVPRPSRTDGSYFISSADIQTLLDRRDAELDASLVHGYLMEALVTVGSPADLTYLLPAILELWRESLDSPSPLSDVLAAALCRQRFLYSYLTPRQRNAVLQFIRTVLLDSLDSTPSWTEWPPGYWPFSFDLIHAYGTYAEDVEVVWRQWWSAEAVGRVWATLTYASLLILDDTQNPIVLPLEIAHPIASSILMDMAQYDLESQWLQPNIAFLSRALSLERVQQHLYQVREHTGPAGQIAAMLHTTLIEDPWRFESRARDLLDYLEGKPGKGFKC